MVLYLIVIVLGMIGVATLNIFFNPLYHDKWWLYIIFTVAFTVLAVIVDAIVAIVIRKMPEKWFQKDKGIFHTGEKELKFYSFLRVQKWKDFIPELGNFTGFHKNKVANPFDNEYIARFILIGFVVGVVGFSFGFSTRLSAFGVFLNYALYLSTTHIRCDNTIRCKFFCFVNSQR